MSSDLSIFAARVRDYMAIAAGESAPSDVDPADWARHQDSEFNGMALVLAAIQYRHNPVFQKLCDARGIRPQALVHWSEIPALPTRAFKDFDVTCLPAGERSRVFHSSGTTGHTPSRHLHSEESLALYEASLWTWFQNQIPGRCKLLALTPPPDAIPNSSLGHMFEVVRRQLGSGPDCFAGRLDSAGGWRLNLDSAIRALDQSVDQDKPLAILGTAFSFVELLDELGQKRWPLPAGSWVMETGGYKGRSRAIPRAELHRWISGSLGLTDGAILSEYGMSELSSQAYARTETAGAVFHFPPWARARVVSPETGREAADGETGLLQIFDLANVFSAMALQTEDLAVRRGAGFELLGRATGAEARGCSLMPAAAPGKS
ncbi:MAG: hypothetical protein U1F98_07380 [Verrucomicrobiota bacterium]